MLAPNVFSYSQTFPGFFKTCFMVSWSPLEFEIMDTTWRPKCICKIQVGYFWINIWSEYIQVLTLDLLYSDSSPIDSCSGFKITRSSFDGYMVKGLLSGSLMIIELSPLGDVLGPLTFDL